MNSIVFAMRLSFTTLILIAALASGGNIGVSKVQADTVPPLKTPKFYADLGSISPRTKPMKGYLVGLFASYFHKQKEQPDQAPPKIVLTSPKATDVIVTQQYDCQIRSKQHIDVRALSSGSLEEISVRAGQAVRKGDVMFKIPMAKARAKPGLEAEPDFSNVIAPFDGIVGRTHAPFGSPIHEGDVLTTLSDNSVMWVYFKVTEAQYLESMIGLNQDKDNQDRKIQLVLADGNKFPQSGKIGAIEPQVNNETGDIAVRADFPNPEGLLRHGQRGTILISRTLHDGIVIPQRAVFEKLAKRYVHVVGADHVVHQREIVVQTELEDNFVIKKGLDVNDRIVLDGVPQVRDGDKVESEFRPPDKVTFEPRNHADRIVVTSPKAKDVIITQRYVCQMHSHRHINVRALESGFLEAIPVKAGQAVKKGDTMFQIRQSPHQARLDVETAEAEPAKPQVKADLAKAELHSSNVIAPFDGIVGRLNQSLGSLIKEGDVFTTLSDNSVMWVYFNVPEKRYLEYVSNGKPHQADKIELVLANQTKFAQPGNIGAIDADFNNVTGNIAFRADFPNPDGLMRHGQTGTILISRALHNAIVIPMRATYENLAERYVYVVGADHVVHRREIEVQNETDDIFVIKKGLDVNDRIVVEGIPQIRDGEKVEFEFRPLEQVMRKQKNQAE